MKTSKYGEIATRFVHINAEQLSRDVLNGKERELPLTNSLILEVLTKFSLFQRSLLDLLGYIAWCRKLFVVQ